MNSTSIGDRMKKVWIALQGAGISAVSGEAGSSVKSGPAAARLECRLEARGQHAVVR
jgi:hypothetical protein